MGTEGAIVVQGPGSVGCWLAATLAAAGEAPILLSRQQQPVEALDLVVLRGEAQGAPEVCRARVVMGSAGSPPREGVGNLLLVCTKASDVTDAVEQGVDWIEEGGTVVVLANGLGHLEAAARVWPEEACLAGTLTYGLRRRSSGVVSLNGEGVLRLGPLLCGAEGDRRTAIVAERLAAAGIATEGHPDGRLLVWMKAALNAGLNPVAALLGVPNGELPTQGAFEMAVAAACEVAEVAGAEGVLLPADGWQGRLRDLCRETAENRCSTLQDLEARRPTEIEALCGTVDRLAEKAGIEAPANRLLAALVRRREQETSA